ncbi:hypothetical protein KI387_028194, partial [Taxus chinensis]
MDAPLDTSTPGPKTHSKAREEVKFALMSRVIESDESSTVQEALQSKSWKDAMDVEYQLSDEKQHLAAYQSSTREETHWMQMDIQNKVQIKWD